MSDAPAAREKPKRLPRTPILFDNAREYASRRRHAAVNRSRQRAPAPQQELLESPLWHLLYADRHAAEGTWVPTWLVTVTKGRADPGGRAVKSEARARVMSELLWWFELAFADRVRADQQPKGGLLRRCRARVYDVEGLQWLAASTRELARRTMLSQSAVADAIKWAEANGLIFVNRGGNSLRFRLNARGLARGYHEATGDPIAQAEFLDADSDATEWTGSRTQAAAYHTARGVTVHNAFVPAVGGDPFLARLLSQVVYRFGDRLGKCRAELRVGGNLYWAESPATLARELASSKSAVKRGLDRLVELGLLLRCVRPYQRPRDVEPRWMTHVRPDVERLLERVREVIDVNAETPNQGDSDDEAE